MKDQNGSNICIKLTTIVAPIGKILLFSLAIREDKKLIFQKFQTKQILSRIADQKDNSR
jgi:hypothetical protein